MASSLHGNTAHSTDVDGFLASHPEVLVGRDSLSEARARIGDDGNTFIVYNKPFSNVVLVQEYDADSKERLFVVALIDDEKAEEYYRKYSDDGEGDSAPARDPSTFLYERAPGRSSAATR